MAAQAFEVERLALKTLMGIRPTESALRATRSTY